jgi:transposase
MHADAISDLFGAKGRAYLASILKALPTETAHMIAMQLHSIDQLEEKIEAIERRVAETLKASPEIRLLRSIPGLGPILAPLVWLEVGDVERFPRAEHLASYAGLVPRIIASGGHIRHGSTCRNVNHYLKWAFVEAANCAIRMKAHREDHIGLLYHRLHPNKGHGRSVVAVARHLAEASYWVLRKKQHYRAPQPHISG